VEKVQERLKVTTSMLNDMKAVKMLGLTRAMSSLIQSYREDEVKTSYKFRRLLVVRLLLCKAS
jgi:ATP-binding cassette, subfamily C (CFTR/MRP), member 1